MRRVGRVREKIMKDKTITHKRREDNGKIRQEKKIEDKRSEEKQREKL
jgi:hypothetical protein